MQRDLYQVKGSRTVGDNFKAGTTYKLYKGRHKDSVMQMAEFLCNLQLLQFLSLLLKKDVGKELHDGL